MMERSVTLMVNLGVSTKSSNFAQPKRVTKMIDVRISQEIARLCPDLQVGVIEARVVNSATSDELWAEIEEQAGRIAQCYALLAVNQRPAIAATRRLYKLLGKDPGRYRVASEQLCRRIIKGLGLYRLTTLIDTVNLVSMVSGYPISGLDADKIAGGSMEMGVGRSGESYHGIGRGELNIEGMPVYRDAQGGIATPTSDEERTKFELNTTHVQICINAFGEEMPLGRAVDWMSSLLERYACGTDITQRIVKP